MEKVIEYKIPNEIYEVMKTIKDNGFDSFIVGGYVRDLILNINTQDIDICTNAPIEVLKKIFKAKSFDEYYSIHFEYNTYSFEITSFRLEHTYQNNKPNNISYTNKLYDDLLRRDFTINTLAIDINGNLIDLLNGMNDINKKLIKVVGNTYERLDEDNTRILRAIRLSNNLGFKLDNEIELYLKENTSKLNSLSKEFIKKELDKIFEYNSSIFFNLDKKNNFSKYLHFSYNKIKQVNSRYGVWAQIECDLPMKKEEKQIINSIKKVIEKKSINTFDVYKYGEEVCIIASNILNINIDEIIKNMPIRTIFDIDIDYLTIKEIIKDNNINKIYRNLENEILSGNLDNEKEKIIKYLKGE